MRTPLAARLGARDHRREKDPRREKRGDNPKECQLEVPGTREVVREHTGQIVSKEATRLRVVVRCGAAEQGLHQEQRGDHEEVPRGRALCRGQ